jgi:preprotein translocase subunit SecY
MTPELRRRIGFTLGALLVYRLGTHVPLPGLDPSAMPPLYRVLSNDILEMIRVSSAGGGIHRISILDLDILPYVSAAIIVQLISAWRRLKQRGEQGLQTINRYTIFLTLVLVVVQAAGIAIGLEDLPNLVTEPGWLFRTSTVVTLTGGTVFLAWLSRQITARGIGNGIALILLTRIVIDLPGRIADALELGQRGLLSSGFILVLAVMALTVTGVIVFMEGARRTVPVLYSSREFGARMIGEGSSPIPFKLNGAGVIPVLIASWLLSELEHGQPRFMILYFVFIVLGTFLYAAMVLGPTEIADELHKHGGVIPGVEPGERTAEHVDGILTRLTLVGAVYLAFVCLVPELLIAHAGLPFYFGGISLLVVVCAIMDLETQVRAHAPIGLEGSRP